MKRISLLLLSRATLLLAAAGANASDAIVINKTNKAPLFDGLCGQDEWQAATKIQLPAQVSVYLMHDGDSLFVCAKGKENDYTVIDLYIDHAETGHLHNLHASAQLGERMLRDKEWSESEFWNLEDWGGFWVPYAGSDEADDGTRPRFLKGSHREIQVLRRKFPGNIWNMMIGVSGLNHEGNYGAEFFYPESAIDNDASTWETFSFSTTRGVKE